ncbi:TetR family transcriptional regulator [Rhodococcus sp. NPDC003318]|uniref:acyl-CoA-like ligand-binding transcription factor n=1 Tax=Rhodococcus sp. NPDC003318 TaxID=3364503 RepID=UPI0036CAAE1A
MSSPKTSEPLQQRLKDRMRSEIAEITIGLYLDKGFDETTVDEICDAAGVSRRTLFRYYRSKEDIVVSHLSKLAEEGCHCFVERPDDEDRWAALRMSMSPFEDWAQGNPSRALALFRLIENAPSLRASYLDRVDRWRASLAAVVSTKFDLDPRTDLEVAVIAAASVGAYLAATRAWAQSDGTESLPALFDRAFDALRPGASAPWG